MSMPISTSTGSHNPELLANIDAGLRELDHGKSTPFDSDAVERIKRAGREKLEAAKTAER